MDSRPKGRSSSSTDPRVVSLCSSRMTSWAAAIVGQTPQTRRVGQPSPVESSPILSALSSSELPVACSVDKTILIDSISSHSHPSSPAAPVLHERIRVRTRIIACLESHGLTAPSQVTAPPFLTRPSLSRSPGRYIHRSRGLGTSGSRWQHVRQWGGTFVRSAQASSHWEVGVFDPFRSVRISCIRPAPHTASLDCTTRFSNTLSFECRLSLPSETRDNPGQIPGPPHAGERIVSARSRTVCPFLCSSR